MYVRIDWSDGQYTLTRGTEEKPLVITNSNVVHVSEEFWKRYEAHCAECRFWYEIISTLDRANSS